MELRQETGAALRLDAVDAAIRRHHHRGDALIEVLHVAQEANGFLSEELLLHVARGLRLPPSRVYGVATFYNLFRHRPRGAHTCTVCLGTACWVDGGDALLAAAEEASGLAPGETSADGRATLEVVRCIGACGAAPVVAYDGRLAGAERPERVRAALGAWGVP